MPSDFTIENADDMNELLNFMVKNQFDSTGNQIEAKYDKLFAAEEGQFHHKQIGIQIGQLSIDEGSNVIDVQLGNLDYDLQNGVQPNFHQELCFITDKKITNQQQSFNKFMNQAPEESGSNSQFAYFIGDLYNKFILKPKIEQLIKK